MDWGLKEAGPQMGSIPQQAEELSWILGDRGDKISSAVQKGHCGDWAGERVSWLLKNGPM